MESGSWGTKDGRSLGDRGSGYKGGDRPRAGSAKTGGSGVSSEIESTIVSCHHEDPGAFWGLFALKQSGLGLLRPTGDDVLRKHRGGPLAYLSRRPGLQSLPERRLRAPVHDAVHRRDQSHGISTKEGPMPLQCLHVHTIAGIRSRHNPVARPGSSVSLLRYSLEALSNRTQEP
ncbi:uncharacterized protein CLUP02_01651 [Colletotrichum lupini]|uniref:Uncharacterized protein n=1 Tax=Colletotrichum lupini TaxID=145971 RepID=A0A9Q8SDB8_9PEZI|nr:uncharacterized protein CLUP02_01651 [Colletotrichum lupini]UQC74998.1 hypothetical protein CLUP02_01651 [Colletotrichum lupini]